MMIAWMGHADAANRNPQCYTFIYSTFRFSEARALGRLVQKRASISGELIIQSIFEFAQFIDTLRVKFGRL